MRFIINVASPPRPVFKDITSRSCVPMYHETFSPFPLLCVVHLTVFLLFSVSLLVSCTVRGVARYAGCFLKSAELILTAGNTSLDSANEPHKFI